MSNYTPANLGNAVPTLFSSAFEYLVDTGQRSVLFLDVMRRRGLQYREHLAETAPHVLDYDVELIVDGRKLDLPVNYALVRILPPEGESGPWMPAYAGALTRAQLNDLLAYLRSLTGRPPWKDLDANAQR